MRVPLLVGSGGQLQYDNIGFNTPVNMNEGDKIGLIAKDGKFEIVKES